MEANTSSAENANPRLTPEQQAVALWTFVHLKVPRFTSNVALDVIRRLAVDPAEVPKSLAKRLRVALEERGIALKQSAAIDAAARLQGYASWHAANRDNPKVSLKLMLMNQQSEELFSDWRKLADRLCDLCETWLQQHGLKVFQLRFGPAYVMVGTPQPRANGPQGAMDDIPLLVVSPISHDEHWLAEAPAAFETLRRRLEETGKAVLDGLAVLQACGRNGKAELEKLPPVPLPVSPSDAPNSELVLLREDTDLWPGYEIARGDEMTCWSQLELALKENNGENIVVEDGAWLIGKERYVWELHTIQPKDIVPGLVLTGLTAAESEKLFRRYKLAKRVFSNKLQHHEVTKRLQYLSGPSDTFRVDLHRVLLELDKAGLSWETFCKTAGLQQEMVPELPVGFVLTLAERLNLKNPNLLFMPPARSELSRVDNDSMLRALLPRVDFLRYRLTRLASDEVRQSAREAVEELASSLQLQKLTSAGMAMDEPLPYLVYACEAEELRLKLEEHGLAMYAGIMPHLIHTEGAIEKLPNMWSYAFGHSLYLDIDVIEGVAQ